MKVDDFTPIELDEGIILSISQLDKILVRSNSFPESYHKKTYHQPKKCALGTKLDKANPMVVDPTGSIKVTFWGDKCKEGLVIVNTYIFKGFRFKSSTFGSYIKSPKSEECSIKKSTSFGEELTEVDPSQLQEIEEDLILLSVENSKILHLF